MKRERERGGERRGSVLQNTTTAEKGRGSEREKEARGQESQLGDRRGGV